MKPSIQRKLEALLERHQELSALLSEPEIVQDQDKFKNLSKEYAELEPIVAIFQSYQATLSQIEQATELKQDSDPDMRSMAEEEIKESTAQLETIQEALQLALLPKDPNDECNVYLEVRAGTGGDEASIFAGDLFRMYSRYAEQQGWRIELVSESLGEHGGYKEVISRIIGQGVYSKLKFESGAHRVQRVPVTESQGRVHTSACTVAILPEMAAVDEVDVNPSDLRIDTYRASGAGGQHVNRTDSAVRITHIPTGTVVECQEERSQHKNKAKAMNLLKSKLLAEEQNKQREERASTRRNLVGSGDRSERIRTYNYPQGRVTDHRINLTLYKLAEVMEGDMAAIIEPLIQEHQTDLLTELAED